MSRRFIGISIVCVGIALFLNFYNGHDKYPKGCDEFGYLQLSNELLGNSERDEFLKPLIQDLEKAEFTYGEYAWLILPHAYHLDAKQHSPINQYQLGTSAVLSLLPQSGRQIFFPLMIFLGGLLLSWFVCIKANANKKSFLIMNLAFFIIAIFAVPFKTELARINSLAFTFIPLLIAGYFLFKEPRYPILILVFCVNFRIANVILIPFAGLLYLKQPIMLKEWMKTIGLSCLLISPLLIYNWIALGNPFAISYSSNDTGWAGVDEIMSNLQYYFSLNQSWFRWYIVTVLLLLVRVLMKKFALKHFLFLVGFTLCNYVFFVVHKVQMNYYPFASLLIAMGVLFNNMLEKEFQKKIWSQITLVFSILTLIVVSIRFAQSTPKNQLNISVLKSYQVVWGDIYVSSSEYVNENNGMRYFAGSNKARKFVVNWLNSNGISQAFLLNDLNIPISVLKTELDDLSLPYKKKEIEGWTLIEM